MSDNHKICSLLLDPNTYNPDTLDLNADSEARTYWFDCLTVLMRKFSVQAARSCKNETTAQARAEQYLNDCMKIINTIKADTESNEPITIRQLLEISDSCLRLNGFTDPWLEEKRSENLASMQQFESRLTDIDKFNENERWMQLFNGIFAGNIFDWGALAVTQILECDKNFGLNEAMKRIQPRPWLIDGFDGWMKRIEGPPHNCAVIFVDNSGVDFILGIVPFARELLKRGTKVIFSANKEPSLNDITIYEMDQILRQCCDKCNFIKNAYETKKLQIFANGQTGVCLDMRRISSELSEAIDSNNVDLLVIEGMARALHTNLNAKFKCETLKLAVVKNKWWAVRLGGDTFGIICKYELPTTTSSSSVAS